MKTKPIGVRFEQEEYDLINSFAERENLSFSDVVRKGAMAYVAPDASRGYRSLAQLAAETEHKDMDLAFGQGRIGPIPWGFIVAEPAFYIIAVQHQTAGLPGHKGIAALRAAGNQGRAGNGMGVVIPQHMVYRFAGRGQYGLERPKVLGIVPGRSAFIEGVAQIDQQVGAAQFAQNPLELEKRLSALPGSGGHALGVVQIRK